MPTHFLLIASQAESIDGEQISSLEMARRRLTAKEWGLWANTPHRNELKPEDIFIVYVTGANGKQFVATAMAKEIQKDPKQYLADGDALTDPPVAVVKLDDIRWFNEPVPIAALKEKLQFIPQGTAKWGCVLQRGVKKIKPTDADLIFSQASATGSAAK